MMQNTRPNHRSRATALCLAFALGGCSLLDPYVRAPELDAAAAGAAGQQLPVAGSSNYALAKAMAAAAAQRRAYYGAVSDRAKLRNGLPLVLVPLAGAALYRGLVDTGDSTRRILMKEGLVGASIFGLGSYYTSSSRELTYLAGAKALSCSLYSMTSYYLPDELATRIGATKVEALNTQLALVRGSAEQLRSLKNAAGTDAEARADISPLLARADASIDGGVALLKRVVEVQAALDDAGARLTATVENVVSEVDVQIARTEPDPAAILTLINGLPASARQFAPGATFTAATKDAPKQVGLAVAKMSKAGVDLPAQITELDKQASAIQFALDVTAQRVKTTPALDTCKVQLAQGTLDIAPEEGVDMKVGETRQFVIRSTAGIPTVDWIGTVSPQVEMTKSLVGESMLVQITYKAPVEGISQVTLQAATKELRKQVTITLAATAAPGAAAASASALGGGAAPSVVAVPPGVPSEPAAGAPGAQNAFEKGLSADQLKALQARFGVAQSAQFDTVTRTAIQRWQKAHSQVPANGVLQRKSALDAIMN